MSDSSGKHSRSSSPRRRGDHRHRPGNRPRKQPRDEMWENHGEEFRLPHRSRRVEDERSPQAKERRAENTAKPTFAQRLLTIVTFGLVRPKPAAAPARHKGKKGPPKKEARDARPPKDRAPRESRPPREPRTPIPANPDAVTGERLHVGNLSYQASESDLMELFNGIGKVQNVEVVYNAATQQSKGFGFVQFHSVNDARRAVSELHGKPFMGRNLLLGPARERRENRRGTEPGAA